MYPRKRFLLDDEYGPQTQMQAHQQGFYENLPEWASEKAPYVLETVSKRSPQRRRNWLAHGNVAQKRKELKQQRDEMVMAPMRQRQEMLQMNAPLGEREKLGITQQHDISMLGARQTEARKADMLDFMQSRMLAGEGREFTAGQAEEGREFTAGQAVEKREFETGRYGIERADAMEDWRAKEEGRIPTPQYDVFQDPGGRQSYLTRGGEIPEGMQRVSPSSVEVNIGPTERPSPSERTEIRDARASLDYLDNLRGLVDSSYVGPIQGRTGPMWALVGQTTQEQNSFYAASSAFKNMIIKQITGAQMSEMEADRILKQVPKPEDPYSVWLSNWEQSKNNVAILLQRQQEVLRQSGLMVPGETPLPWDAQSDDVGSMSTEQLLEALRQMQ